MTRRSTGKTRVARSVWYARKGTVELRAAPLPRPQPGEAVVRTLFSGISRGTERLVFNGEVGTQRVGAHALPQPGGRVPLPGQIRLLRHRSGRGGPRRAARAHGVLPASAPGPFQRDHSQPGAGAGRRSGAAGDADRQHGDGAQRAVGQRRRAGRPHRRGGCRRGGACSSQRWRRGCPARTSRAWTSTRAGGRWRSRWALGSRRPSRHPATRTSCSMPAPRRPGSTPPSIARGSKARSSR